MPEDAPEIDPKHWYWSSEVGEILGVHSSTVRRMATRGAIPFRMTPGGLRQYLGKDVVVAWLQMYQYLEPEQKQ